MSNARSSPTLAPRRFSENSFTVFGLPIMLLCLALQAAVTFWSVRYYLRQSGRVLSGHGLLAHVRPLLAVMIVMMLGNFVQIVIWGVLFIFLGEFSEFVDWLANRAPAGTQVQPVSAVIGRE